WPHQTGCDITEGMAQDRPLDNAELLSVLDWYRAAGVDIAVGEEPVDRFAQIPQPVPAAPRNAQPRDAGSDTPAPPVAIGGDPSEARQLAASAGSLEELRGLLEAYDGC